jgi:myo-inositol-1(or 4)-monophosphatase
LVSDLDVAIERAVRGFFADQTPDIAFLGEEEGRSGSDAAGWLWTLDPIDGTSNFAHGIPLCAISLALVRDGRPVLAIIDAPFIGERYHAVEGHGAHLGDTRLNVSDTARLRDAVVAIGDYAVGPQAARRNETSLATTVALTSRVHRIRMLGTIALDLAWVAAGRLDASITLANHPWDTAAGVLLAREAGATVTDMDGTPHTFDSAATIAAAPPLITPLTTLISQASSAPRQQHEERPAPVAPYAALDAVLHQARYLIFDIDGPVCDLTAALPADLPDQLRTTWRATSTDMPPLVADSNDPQEILTAAANLSSDLAAQLDAQLIQMETSAASQALPAGYIHEAIAACRDSGRTPAITGRHTASTIAACLNAHGLADAIQTATGTPAYPHGHLSPWPELLAATTTALAPEPAACALISACPDAIDAARQLGIPSIGYASSPASRQRLTVVGPTCSIVSLADLTLRLRARPLPN